MSLSEDADFPACPDCWTNLLVQKSTNGAYDWYCNNCQSHYRNHQMQHADTYQ